jgi:hypothetical protein
MWHSLMDNWLSGIALDQPTAFFPKFSSSHINNMLDASAINVRGAKPFGQKIEPV